MTDKYIREYILTALKKVEGEWTQIKSRWYSDIGDVSESFELQKADITTNIPGYEIVKMGKPEVATFIAFMLDMRKSSTHLLQAHSKSGLNGMQRVLYETTALNAMGTLVFEQYGGGITEFLGDGFLGFFLVNDIDDKDKARNAHKAARACLRITHNIINHLLEERYNLEPLDIGIGMAYSQAMITTVGSGDNLQPKAIGQCVYRASKLCKGQNTITVDKALRTFWPRSENGKLRFIPRKDRSDKEKLNFESFVIHRKPSV